MSTIIKALDILELFSATQPSLGLTETARLLGRDKASVLRHLTALEAKGMVEQDAKTKQYHLGPALSRLALVREQTAPANQSITHVVQQLARDTGETTHLSRYANGRLVQGKVIDSTHSGLRVHLAPEEELPLHASASGIAFLSACNNSTLQQALSKPLMAYTQTTPCTQEAVLEKVAQVRSDGFAIAEGTFEYDTMGVAAPVYNSSSEVCGAIAVATPRSRFSDATRDYTIGKVLQAARQVSWHQGAALNIIDQFDKRIASL